MITQRGMQAWFAAALVFVVSAVGAVTASAQDRLVAGVVRDCVSKRGIQGVMVSPSSSDTFVGTDSLGRFALGAPRKAVVIVARRAGYDPQRLELHPGNDTGVVIAMRPSMSVPSPPFIQCEKPPDALGVRTLRGFVRDSATDEPIELATVLVQGSPLGTLTTGRGAFMIVGVQRDSLVLSAHRRGYVSAYKPIASGGDTTITFYLKRSVTPRLRADAIPAFLEPPLGPRHKLAPR